MLHSHSLSAAASTPMELRATNHGGTSRMGLFATRNYQAGEIIVEEAPMLMHQPNIDRDNRKVQVTNLEMQLPFRWIAQERDDEQLRKLGMTYKTLMLPEDEFLQDMDSWTDAKTQEVYETFQRRCFVDVIYIHTQFPKVSMQTAMKVANILSAYTLPITNPLSGHMMGVFVCSGKGSVSRMEHSCRPNCFYMLENTQGDKLNVRVMAQQPIRAGEELTISYLGPNHAHTNWQERGPWLHQLLGFTCECALCAAEQALLRNLPEDVRQLCTPVRRKAQPSLSKDEHPRDEDEHRSNEQHAQQASLEKEKQARKEKRLAEKKAREERKKARAQQKMREEQKELAAEKVSEQRQERETPDVDVPKASTQTKKEVNEKEKDAYVPPPFDAPLPKRDFTIHESLRMVLAAGSVFRLHGHVTDPKAAHLFALSCEAQLATVFEHHATRTRAITLLRSMRQHLARSDQTTDRVLAECWQLLRFLSDPDMMNTRARNKIAKRKKQTGDLVPIPTAIDGMPPELHSARGLRLWPEMLLRFLELFLRSFLIHGFQRTSGENRKKLTWMITPQHLKTYLMRLVELQHEQFQKAGRDLLPFQMRVLIGVLLILLDQHLDPESFAPPPTEASVAPDMKEEAEAIESRATSSTPSDAEKKTQHRTARNYRHAQTLALLTVYFRKLNVPKRISNVSLLLETANAHCFAEWNASLLMAACIYDAPSDFFNEVESSSASAGTPAVAAVESVVEA